MNAGDFFREHRSPRESVPGPAGQVMDVTSPVSGVREGGEGESESRPCVPTHSAVSEEGDTSTAPTQSQGESRQGRGVCEVWVLSQSQTQGER